MEFSTMGVAARQQKVWADPRFSLNALMKYTGASAVNRRRLIHEQKYPAVFKVIWYEVAGTAIKRFVAGGMADESIITSEIGRLSSLVPSNEQEEQKYDGNIEAMQSFLNSYDGIDLHGLAPKVTANNPPHMAISGVDVSIRPDVLLAGDLRGKEAGGALKLYFSKGDPLAQETGRHGAVTLFMHTRDNLPGSTIVRPQFCSIFDVFAGRNHPAPTAYSQRAKNLEFSCAEIAALWPTI
jgi:hypothetical protein